MTGALIEDDKIARVFFFPKNHGIAPEQVKVLKELNWHIIEVQNPDKIFEAVMATPIPLPQDAVTKCMFEALCKVNEGREEFGRRITKYMENHLPKSPPQD